MAAAVLGVVKSDLAMSVYLGLGMNLVFIGSMALVMGVLI